MVLTPDPHLNLRADIKATLVSLEARIRAGGNWRGAASVARELAEKLEALADMDGDGPRTRRIEPDVRNNPVSWRARRRHTPPAPTPHTYEVTEVKRTPPELGPGS